MSALEEGTCEYPPNAKKILKVSEVTVSPKMPTRNYQDFCPGSLLEGRAEILVIFGWHFGRSDDLFHPSKPTRRQRPKAVGGASERSERGRSALFKNPLFF